MIASVQWLVVVGRRLLLKRADIAAPKVFFGRRVL
jgi:hypothetical protein